MRTPVKILLGCLATPFVLIALLLTLALIFRAAGSPGHKEEMANLEQPLPTVTPEQLAAEGLTAGSGVPAGSAVSITLRLEEGHFTVRAGPPGSGVKVEGNYDSGAYELRQEFKQDGSGGPAYFLSFRPRYSMLRRVLTEGGVHLDDDDNRMTVWLPRGVPISLDLQSSKGESNLELGGLALSKAVLDVSMGEHHMTVGEVNPIEMTSLDINAGMGEVDFADLGNLRAESISIFTKMGEVDVDLGETIQRDTKMFVRHKMGELTVGLPRDARIHANTSTFIGDGAENPSTPADVTTGPLLDITTKMTMGEMRFKRR